MELDEGNELARLVTDCSVIQWLIITSSSRSSQDQALSLLCPYEPDCERTLSAQFRRWLSEDVTDDQAWNAAALL